MDQLNTYELISLLKFWSGGFEPSKLMAERIVQIATALLARMERDAAAEAAATKASK